MEMLLPLRELNDKILEFSSKFITILIEHCSNTQNRRNNKRHVWIALEEETNRKVATRLSKYCDLMCQHTYEHMVQITWMTMDENET